jgi:hypothetical protein
LQTSQLNCSPNGKNFWKSVVFSRIRPVQKYPDLNLGGGGRGGGGLRGGGGGGGGGDRGGRGGRMGKEISGFEIFDLNKNDRILKTKKRPDSENKF